MVDIMIKNTEERIESNEGEIDKLKQIIDILQQNVRTEIFTAVKRVQMKMQTS